MKLRIYLKHNMGYLVRETTERSVQKLIENIMGDGIQETVGSTHTYYPPNMIMYFQW